MKNIQNLIPNADQILAECPEHGPFLQRKIELPGKVMGKGECPKCAAAALAQHQKEQAENIARFRKERIQYTVPSFGKYIPTRFRGVSFDNYEPDCERKLKALDIARKYAQNFPHMLDQGAGLIFCGTPGTGKTHLAISIGCEVAEQGYYVEYHNLFDIIREIRDTWTDDTKHESQVIARYQTKDLLIIDEVGVQAGSENERNLIFEIINGRYENVMPTIILSNLARQEISKLISERSMDRITEGGGGTIVFNWESYRNRRPAA